MPGVVPMMLLYWALQRPLGQGDGYIHFTDKDTALRAIQQPGREQEVKRREPGLSDLSVQALFAMTVGRGGSTYLPPQHLGS